MRDEGLVRRVADVVTFEDLVVVVVVVGRVGLGCGSLLRLGRCGGLLWLRLHVAEARVDKLPRRCRRLLSSRQGPEELPVDKPLKRSYHRQWLNGAARIDTRLCEVPKFRHPRHPIIAPRFNGFSIWVSSVGPIASVAAAVLAVLARHGCLCSLG